MSGPSPLTGVSPRVQGISPDPFPHERVGAGYKVREGGGEGRGRRGKGVEREGGGEGRGRRGKGEGRERRYIGYLYMQ